jgi:thymidylate kinase
MARSRGSARARGVDSNKIALIKAYRIENPDSKESGEVLRPEIETLNLPLDLLNHHVEVHETEAERGQVILPDRYTGSRAAHLIGRKKWRVPTSIRLARAVRPTVPRGS